MFGINRLKDNVRMLWEEIHWLKEENKILSSKLYNLKNSQSLFFMESRGIVKGSKVVLNDNERLTHLLYKLYPKYRTIGPMTYHGSGEYPLGANVCTFSVDGETFEKEITCYCLTEKGDIKQGIPIRCLIKCEEQ